MNYFLSSILLALGLLLSSQAQAIKKCQDADGNMHYGDVAVAECENSKITTLNDRGFVEDELAAPKTDEELAAEEAERQRVAAQEQARRDAAMEKQRILSIYETEADIDRQRENQLRSVQSNIDVHHAYLKNMNLRMERFEQQLAETTGEGSRKRLAESIAESQSQIAEFSEQLSSLQDEKRAIIERFDQEKEVYRRLKAGE